MSTVGIEFARQGWECPVCHVVYAPTITKCETCRPRTLGERLRGAHKPIRLSSKPKPGDIR